MSWTLDQAAQIATIAGFVIAAISLAGLAFSAYRYVQVRGADLRQRRFENYHALLKLAIGDGGGEAMFVDRQAAAIFELRNYREYCEISTRILSRLKEKCLEAPDCNSRPVQAVIDEISLTLFSLNER